MEYNLNLVSFIFFIPLKCSGNCFQGQNLYLAFKIHKCQNILHDMPFFWVGPSYKIKNNLNGLNSIMEITFTKFEQKN